MEPTLLQKRMLTAAAVFSIIPTDKLEAELVQEIFARTMYYNELPETKWEIKAKPLIRKLCKQSDLDASWIK